MTEPIWEELYVMITVIFKGSTWLFSIFSVINNYLLMDTTHEFLIQYVQGKTQEFAYFNIHTHKYIHPHTEWFWCRVCLAHILRKIILVGAFNICFLSLLSKWWQPLIRLSWYYFFQKLSIKYLLTVCFYTSGDFVNTLSS